MILLSIKKRKNRREGGQTIVLIALLFTIVTTTVVYGMVNPVLKQFSIGQDLQTSKQSYFAAESGSEDVYYRIRNNLTTSFPELLTLDNSTASSSLTVTGSNEEQILSTAYNNNIFRTVDKDITVTDGFAFNFAVQVGAGGLWMHDNGSLVVGNVYSNGPVWGQSTNKIYGDVVSAGSSGSITNVHATSSAYAHSISNSVIDKDAYYVSISNTTVSRTSYPGSTDQPPVPMPIADSLLDQWESDALAGGLTSCSGTKYISSNVTWNAQKINCDVEISGNDTTVIIKGSVWINGDLRIKNSPKFRVDDSVGNKSVAVLAHSTSNPTTKGIISIENSPLFYASMTDGVANPDSYVMLISRNTSTESGGEALAIHAGSNTAGNLLLYAPHGEIKLENNVILREVTGYKLSLFNNTEVVYSIGLAQPLFTAGPGGQWKIKRWRESHEH